MNYVVEVHYTGGDWADLVADMRSWLSRRQIETEKFEHSRLSRSIDVRVGFRDVDHAAAFASVFSGRLLSATADHAGAVGSVSHPAGNDAGPSFSDGSTVSDDLPCGNAQPAAKASPAGVSLMITRQQKADLRKRGYSEEEIGDMKPQEAHRLLGLID